MTANKPYSEMSREELLQEILNLSTRLNTELSQHVETLHAYNTVCHFVNDVNEDFCTNHYLKIRSRKVTKFYAKYMKRYFKEDHELSWLDNYFKE